MRDVKNNQRVDVCEFPVDRTDILFSFRARLNEICFLFCFFDNWWKCEINVMWSKPFSGKLSSTFLWIGYNLMALCDGAFLCLSLLVIRHTRDSND